MPLVQIIIIGFAYGFFMEVGSDAYKKLKATRRDFCGSDKHKENEDKSNEQVHTGT